MSQLVKEAEIEAVQGVEGGWGGMLGLSAHKEGRIERLEGKGDRRGAAVRR